jgi:hypothetical protein
MKKKRKSTAAPRRLGSKLISFASSDEMRHFSSTAASFMQEVFELEPSDYVISDESTLRDFTFLGMSDTTPAWVRIEELYGLSRLEVRSEHLFHIFAAIERNRVANWRQCALERKTNEWSANAHGAARCSAGASAALERTRGVAFVDRRSQSMNWDKVALACAAHPRAVQLAR